MQRRLVLLAMLAAIIGTPAASVAQEAFPNRLVRIVVPFPAGGIVDVVARIIGQRLSEKYGQSVIVDNKPGAGGSIGTDVVAHAAPDGYTMLMVGPGFVVLPQILKNLTWSPGDFRSVLSIGSVPNILVVPSTSKIASIQDLLDQARKNPESITYGSPGVGSTPHLSGELLAQLANVKLTHIPYKGQPEAMADLLGGRISMMALSAALAGSHIKSGKLRALGVTANTRIKLMPELPTIAEAAHLPEYDVRPWTAVFVPKQTPPAITEKLAADFMAVLSKPEVVAQLQAAGMELNPIPTKKFDAAIAAESEKWARVMRKAGVTPQ
jgi:tripartite-type tricarboxylate transporter receptor subunit TctC